MPWSTFLRIGLILVLAGCDAQQSANAPTVLPSARDIEQLTMLHDQLRQARMNIEVQYQQAPGRETSCVKPPFLFIAPETLIGYDVDFIKASKLVGWSFASHCTTDGSKGTAKVDATASTHVYRCPRR